VRELIRDYPREIVDEAFGASAAEVTAKHGQIRDPD
jgi:hypothetical protein